MEADFLLIKRMKHGDEVAFDIFVRKYYEEILKYCCYHCSDIAYAEDLTQETFIRFFTKLSDYRHLGKTRSYLYTIAGNLCRDYYKKKRETPLEEPVINKVFDLSKNHEEAVVNKITIEWALKKLPDELSEIVILYYFQRIMKVKFITAYNENMAKFFNLQSSWSTIVLGRIKFDRTLVDLHPVCST